MDSFFGNIPSKVKQSVINSGAAKVGGNLQNAERLYSENSNNLGGNITGVVVATPIIFDASKSSFVVSDNAGFTDDTKSRDYRKVYYYSSEKSPEVLSPSDDLLNLPENDTKFQLFIAALGHGIGGGQIIIDCSKNEVPNRGDVISFSAPNIKDKAKPVFEYTIIRSNKTEINPSQQGASLKEQAKSGQKVDPEDNDIEVPGEFTVATPNSNGKIPFTEVPTDAYKKTFLLRKDAAEAYKKIYDEVKKNGGKMIIAGGLRTLDTKAGVGASKKSLHYIGRAFDIAIKFGLQNVKKDPYLVTVDENNRWVVWCKTNNTNFPEIELDAIVWKPNTGGINNREKVKARVFNFTEIAKKYGFSRIRGWPNFYKVGDQYDEAEWWHYQYQAGLVAGGSVYGEEMLLVYPKEVAEKFIYWEQSKDLTWDGLHFSGKVAKKKVKVQMAV